MGDSDSPAPGVDEPVSQQFRDRQADLVLEPVEPDISTSPEATKILMEQGVDAWREWVAAQQ